MKNTEVLAVKSSSVYKGLENLNKGENIALVMDVTGSMSGHIAALMNWIRTNSKDGLPFTSYTFFNDGDKKPKSKKKIGKTGGIYMTTLLEDVQKTIKKR